MNREYLNTEEAAERYGMSRRFFEEGRRQGYGPAYVAFGKSVRYRVKDLEAWVEAHVVKAEAA